MGRWIVGHLSMEVSDMKKFILHILLFWGIVAVVDVFAGVVFKYLQLKAGGRTEEMP